MNLSDEDMLQVQGFQKIFDLKNLRMLWQGMAFDRRGYLDEKGIEEAFLLENYFPDFVYGYLNKHEDPVGRLKNFSKILTRFLETLSKEFTGLFSWYCDFEKRLRLTLVALRAKDMKIDILPQLRYEDPQDFLVQQIISQKDLPSYEPIEEFKKVKQLYEAHKNDPLKLYKEILQYRFDQILDQEEKHPFSIDQVMGYMIRLTLVEDWQILNPEQGKKIIEERLKYE